MNSTPALGPESSVACTGAGVVAVPLYDELQRLDTSRFDPIPAPPAESTRLTPHGCAERAAALLTRAEDESLTATARAGMLHVAMGWRELGMSMCQQIGMIPPRPDDDSRR